MASAAPGEDNGLEIQSSSESSPHSTELVSQILSAASIVRQKRITATSEERLGAEVLPLGR